jgi:hypothetical protein
MAINQFEVGYEGLLEFYPPFPQGVPTNATLQVIKPDGTDLHAAASVTADTVATTFTGVSKDARTIELASAAGVSTARRYWVATDGGRGYEAQPIGVDGNIVTLADPVPFDISSGTFTGHGLRVTLSTTETATKLRNCRVVWRYTALGLSQVERDMLDIVPTPFSVPVTEADIKNADPTWTNLSSDYNRLRTRAIEDVFILIKNWQKEPDQVQDRRLLVPAVVWRMRQLRSDRSNNPDAWENYEGEYTAAMNHHQQSLLFVDYNDDGTLDEATSLDGNHIEGGDLNRQISYAPVG